MKPIVFLDLETTGLDPRRHEILEIGAVRVDPMTLAILAEAEVRVAPRRLEDAEPDALRVNGYAAKDWTSALGLDVALGMIAPLLEGAILAGHNPSFDRGFLVEGWQQAGVTPPPMDYHLLDTASLAWPLYSAGAIEKLSLSTLCAHFGIERPSPHRALADAHASRELARRLLPSNSMTMRASALQGDEHAIAELLLSRLDVGRATHGPWHVDDGHHYLRGALLHIIDGLHASAAELVRLDQARRSAPPRRPRIYVCCASAENDTSASAELRGICRSLVEAGAAPIVPYAYLDHVANPVVALNDEHAFTLDLLEGADALHVYGTAITDRMRRAIRHAEARAIPVRFATMGGV
jgi:DNA polymerase-3 subunit epsilon